MTINLDTLFRRLFLFLLSLSIIIPTVHKDLKIVILLCLIPIILYKIFSQSFKLHKDIAVLFFISLVFGLLFVFNGIIHSNPGAIPSLTVIVIWPILYFLFIGVNGTGSIFKSLDKVFLFSAYFIPIYGFYFLFGKIGFIPSSLFFNIFPENTMGGVGLYEGSIEVSILNLSSLLFVAPYVFTKNLLIENNIKEKLTYSIAIFLMIGLIFISGRRALLLVALGSFLMIYILTFFISNQNLKTKLKKRWFTFGFYLSIFSFIVISIVLYYYEVDLSKMYNAIIEGLSFGTSSDPSTQARTMQFYSLINGWEEHPIIGNGFGAVASVIRNEVQPWAYELSYMALLFHTGIIGIILYFSLVVWIVIQGLKLTYSEEHTKYIFPYIIGMISFLIGNMSNPYLMKFDYLWVIFIPIMYINYSLLNNKKVKQQ